MWKQGSCKRSGEATKKDHGADAHLPKSPRVETPSRAPTPHPPLWPERGLVSGAGRGGAHREQEELMVAQEVSPGSGNSDRHRQAATKTTGITRTHTHTHAYTHRHITGVHMPRLRGKVGSGAARSGGLFRGWGCGETRVLGFSGRAAAGVAGLLKRHHWHLKVQAAASRFCREGCLSSPLSGALHSQ